MKIDREDLNKIIEEQVEQKVEERTKNLEKKIEKQRKKINRLQNSKTNNKTQQKEQISRRSFLKKLGAGAIGLSALTLPGTALDIKDSNLEVFTGTGPDSLQKYLTVNQGGPVEITNTSLQIKENTALHAGNLSNYDATQLSGNNGTNGQILQTDGNNTTWTTIDTNAPVDSVNSQTGTVNLDYNDVGALADHEYNPEADTHSRPTSTSQDRTTGGFTTYIDESIFVPSDERTVKTYQVNTTIDWITFTLDVDDSNSQTDIEIRGENNNKMYSHSTNGTKDVDEALPQEYINEIEFSVEATDQYRDVNATLYLEMNTPTVPSHNHTI